MLLADTVVTNTTVHTMNPDEPLATWFAVLAGNIVAVGSVKLFLEKTRPSAPVTSRVTV